MGARYLLAVSFKTEDEMKMLKVEMAGDPESATQARLG